MRAAALALLLASPLAAAPPAPLGFTLDAPKDWTTERSGPGLAVLAPKEIDGVRARFYARYYPPGDPEYPDYATFLARQTGAGLPGPAPVRSKARLAGSEGARFDWSAPAGGERRRPVELKRTLVAAPAGRGFLLLLFVRPAAADKTVLPAFQQVLRSLKPAP